MPNPRPTPVKIHHSLTLLFGSAIAAFAPATVQAEPFAQGQIEVVEPRGTVDRATLPTRLAWCSGTYSGEQWDTGRIHRAAGSRGLANWADAAAHLCQHPTDPSWLLQAQYLIQEWMNERNLAQADAEQDIADTIGKLKEQRANEGKPATDEQRFAFGDADLSPVKPDAAAPVAQIGARIGWCDQAPPADKWQPGRIGRTVASRTIDDTIQGALHVCQRPTDPTWRVEAGHILQQWMNWSRLPQAQAEASIRARIQQSKFASERAALCKALEVGPEVGGETKVFADAEQRFFGCGSEQPLWIDARGTTTDVAFYLEAATHPTSEILRMYWLFNTVESPFDHELPSTDAAGNRKLIYYAIAQHDFEHLDTAALDRMLAAPPYNDYARTVVMESVGLLKARRQAYEQAIDKLTKGDKDYQHLLRDVPKQAVADWTRLAEQWKPELERSSAFEHKLSEPSRAVLKGCAPELAKDVQKLILGYKEATYQGLITKLGADPIASLLLSRLAICYAADGIHGLSGALDDLVENSRAQRGPRSAVYYALVDAIATVRTDRPRLLLQIESLQFTPGATLSTLGHHYRDELGFSGHAPRDPELHATRGIVKSVTKLADGVQIVFKTDKFEYPQYDCVATSKPFRINLDGTIEYYEDCKANGKLSSQDNTPAPLVVSPLAAAGLAPGVTVVVGYADGKAKNGDSFGYVMYVKTKAKDTKLKAFFGFAL